MDGSSFQLDCEFIFGALGRGGHWGWHIPDKSLLTRSDPSTITPASVVRKISHMQGKCSPWCWESEVEPLPQLLSSSRKTGPATIRHLQGGTPIGRCLPECLRLARAHWACLLSSGKTNRLTTFTMKCFVSSQPHAPVFCLSL